MTEVIHPNELQSGLSNRQKKFIRNRLPKTGFKSLREYYVFSEHGGT